MGGDHDIGLGVGVAGLHSARSVGGAAGRAGKHRLCRSCCGMERGAGGLLRLKCSVKLRKPWVVPAAAARYTILPASEQPRPQ